MHLKFDYLESRKPATRDYWIKSQINEKRKAETLFGRFGIGEIVLSNDGFVFRLKRQILFERKNEDVSFKPDILNFWWGTSGNSKRITG